ncbi:MAG TPA: hypothetical protein VM754_02590 [Actinomycetota bacterium]|nr:hypothetical protein [Actinomycetota bacterium]
MTPQQIRMLAYAVAAARVGIGTAAILTPGLAMRIWLGADPHSSKVKAMAMAIGARDIALGVGTLQALGDGRNPAVWLKVGALADAADGLGTLRALRRTSSPRILIGFIAGGVAAASWLAGSRLEETGRGSA